MIDMKNYFKGILAFACIVQIGAAQTAEVILQKEQIRRQEITLKAAQQLSEANKLISEGKYDQAKEIVDRTLAEVPEHGEGKQVIKLAKTLSSDLLLIEARKAAELKSWFDVREKAKKALEINPDNLVAKRLFDEAGAELGIDSQGRLNPAVDRRLLQDLNEIERLYQQGVELKNTGQLDLAAASLVKILRIDVNNLRAAKLLKDVNKKRYLFHEQERKLLREQKLTEIRKNWTELVAIEANELENITNVIPIERSNEFAIQEKLRSIIVPNVDIVEGSISDATALLTAKSRELDPTGVGISFLIKNDAVVEQSKPITLNLTNIPLSELLRYISNLAGVKYKVEEFAVFFVPLSEPDDVLITREFPVRATFFDVETANSNQEESRTRRRRRSVTQASQNESTDSVRAALIARGVMFSDGATAIYNRATGILTVRNSQDQIDLIEELVTEDQGETLMVKIEAKFVEINQSDLEELTPRFNLQGSYSPLPGGGDFQLSQAAVSVGNNFGGAGNLSVADGINRIINIDPALGNASTPQTDTVEPNQLGITGTIDGNRFATLIDMISQKTSSDIMSAPSVIVNDGTQANITVSREFSFPTEYDPPQVESRTFINSVEGIGTFDFIDDIFTDTDTTTEINRTIAIPSFPTDFEERNVGVSMSVKPQITVDKQRVYLTLQPELVEFDGFVNYGSVIRDPLSTDNRIISINEIRQPVFSTRTVENAQLEIQDGYTMVLGGLIREDISTVDEKIPLLGDLPLLGRAFRSKAEQSIKRNLLIFISVRILRPDGKPYNNPTAIDDNAALAIQ